MRISLLYVTILFSFFAPAQNDSTTSKEVEILNADVLHLIELDGKKHTCLAGNVALKQDQVYLYCDSADIDKAANSMQAWGHVRIANDTVSAFCDYLQYNSNEKLMRLVHNASITDGKARIVSNELFYNTRLKWAYYLTGGKVFRDNSIIKSRVANYYTNLSEVYFVGNVDITDPDYHLTSDSLMYNTNTDYTYFFGHTTIFNIRSKILCNSGWFDTKSNVCTFGKNTTLLDGSHVLKADSLFYDRNRNFGRALASFHWRDSTMEVDLFGQRGEYYEKRDHLKAWNNAFLIYKLDNDSLFLTGDTLRTIIESERDSTRCFYAYKHMKMYTRQMRGACDSLRYSFRDSTFRMYQNPIIWADSTQMTSDSIALKLKNKKADVLSLYNAAFVVSPSANKYFDQIKGKNIYGYFADNQLQKMFVDGNAESLYFGKNDNQKYIGINTAKSINMWLYFKDKRIHRIAFVKKAEALFTPMKMTTTADYELKNFLWQIARMPRSREEIMHR